MGSYCIGEGGVDILSLRIMHQRRKIRNIKKGIQKKRIQLEKEELAIDTRLRKAVYIEPQPPYQNGWKRSFALRELPATTFVAKFRRRGANPTITDGSGTHTSAIFLVRNGSLNTWKNGRIRIKNKRAVLKEPLFLSSTAAVIF